MLSRTADHLFWMARYMERAENTARMLDVNYQTSLLPQSAAVAQVGWQGLLSISELMPRYAEKHGDIDPQRVMEFMVKDESNPSSIVSCLKAARENARAVRGSLTNGIVSNPFLEQAFRTDRYTIKVDVHPDGTWSYEQDTLLIIPGQAEPFHHTDRNRLRKIGEATPNPTAVVARQATR